MTHAAYVYPAIGDDLPQERLSRPVEIRHAQGRDPLGLSLRIAGVVSLLSGAAVIFGLSRVPDIDLNSAPGQPGYVAQLDAAAGAPGAQEVRANGPLLVTLTDPNYADPSIVHAAPLPVMYAQAGAMPGAVPVNATVSVSGDEMSRLIHGDDGDAEDGAPQAMACNEPCAAVDDRTAQQPAAEPVAYVDGVPTDAAPTADAQ